MVKERILITVKTYPTLSTKYGETVCTAGIRADGTWIRMYPVPFRRLGDAQRYRKFDWIECRLQRNEKDQRPETYRPVDVVEFDRVGHVGIDDRWRDRRALLLKSGRVYHRLEEIIAGAKANAISLAVFKPARLLEFVWEEDSREVDYEKLREMRDRTNQLDLFDDNTWRETFELVPKLPYKFYYRFEDADGTTSRMRILDWEIGALYWNCVRDAGGDEAVALAKVKQKYWDKFIATDLHLFLGTTQQWHAVAPNPWVIIGVFPIPHEVQMDLF